MFLRRIGRQAALLSGLLTVADESSDCRVFLTVDAKVRGVLLNFRAA